MTARIVALAAIAAFSLSAAAQQTIAPAFQGVLIIESYAQVEGPNGLDFAPDGTLYVGRDLGFAGGNGATPTRPWRIAPAATAPVPAGNIEEWGNADIPDPDAVLFDGAGIIGNPGSLLVAGAINAGVGPGRLSSINPDETIDILFESTMPIDNFNGLGFLSDNTLVIGANDGDYFKYDPSGPSLTPFFSVGPVLAGGVNIDGNDRIFFGASDGNIYVVDGTQASPTPQVFFSGLATGTAAPPTGVVQGPGSGFFGDDVYTVDRATGELLRIDSATGNLVAVIGEGFTNANGLVADLEFGPDGFLYASLLNTNRIIRIIPEPGTAALLALAGLALIRRR